MGFMANIKDDDYRVNSMASQAPPIEQLTPDGTFEGLGSAVGLGIVSGAASAARTVGGVAATVFGSNDAMDILHQAQQSGNVTPDTFNQAAVAMTSPADDTLKRVQDWAKIDPRVTGTGAQILGSTAHGMTVFGLGSLAGGPLMGGALLGGTSAKETYEEAQAQGVDDTTATKMAAVSGVAGLAGAVIPGGFGTNLLARMATGIGVNTGFGIAQRATTSAILESAGYKDMAAQYKALDGASLTADAILGVAFGGLSHFHGGRATGEEVPAAERPAPPDIEAAMEARRADAIERGGPGIPTDPEHATLNTDLQDRAVGDMIRGETPSVTADEAHAMLQHTLVDPERVQINQEYVQAGKDVHGQIADFSEPERLPEAAVSPLAKEAPVEVAPTGEAPASVSATQATAALPPELNERLQQLAAQHPDLDVQLPNGQTVKASDLPQAVAMGMDNATRESALHDAAVACFTRTL